MDLRPLTPEEEPGTPDFGDLIDKYADQFGVPRSLARGLFKQESGFNPKAVNAETVATGLGQLMPATAGNIDRTDPEANIKRSLEYLREGFDREGNTRGALHYYYGGPDTKQWGPKTRRYPDQVLRHVPPEERMAWRDRAQQLVAAPEAAPDASPPSEAAMQEQADLAQQIAQLPEEYQAAAKFGMAQAQDVSQASVQPDESITLRPYDPAQDEITLRPYTEAEEKRDRLAGPKMYGVDAKNAAASTLQDDAPPKPKMLGGVTDIIPDGTRTGPPVTARTSAAIEQQMADPAKAAAILERPDFIGASARVNDPAVQARTEILYDEAIKKGSTPEAAIAWAQRNAIRAEDGSWAPVKWNFDTARQYKDANVLKRVAAKTKAQVMQQAGGIVQAGLDFIGADEWSDAAAAVNGRYQQTLDAIGDKRRGAGYLEEQLEGALTSIGTQGAQMLYASLGGPGAATLGLSTMFMQQFGQEYTQGRAKGLTQAEALERATIFGGSEVLGEVVGLPYAKQFARAISGLGLPPEAMRKVMANYFLHEMTGEQITTALEFAYDKFGAAGLNKQATLEDYLKAVGDTAVQTAMQTGITQAAGKALHHFSGQAQEDRLAAAAEGARAAPGQGNAEPPPMRRPTPKELQGLGLTEEQANKALDTLDALNREDEKNMRTWERQKTEQQWSEAASQETFPDSAAAIKEAVRLNQETGQVHRARLIDGKWRVVNMSEVPDEATQGGSKEPVGSAAAAQPAAETEASARAGEAPAAEAVAPVQLSTERGQAPAVDTVDAAAHAAATSPQNDKTVTPAQQLGGNAELGHPEVSGMGISIENADGSERRDLKNDPPKWSVPMKGVHYGYFKGTVGFDKDHLDTFLKAGTPTDWKGTAFVVNQNHGNGKFDEHKVMLGFDTEGEARAAYLAHYEPGWESRIRSITPMPFDEFKAWAYDKSAAGPKGGPKEAAKFPAKQPGDLEGYAKKLVGSGQVKSVHLVGSSTTSANPNDTDILYELPAGINTPEDVEAALEKIEDIDLDTYDTFIKSGDRYYHLTQGAGRAVVANDDYAKQQEGKPKRLLAGAQPETAARQERRVDNERRKSVDQMDFEERGKALLTSEKTGLPNLRAFEEDEKRGRAPVIGYADGDTFKAVNAILGHDPADKVLHAMGQIFAKAQERVGGKAYHRSGDEFLFRFTSPKQAEEFKAEAYRLAAETVLEIEANDGILYKYENPGFSLGHGSDRAQAESAANTEKQRRLETGERGRDRPPGLSPKREESQAGRDQAAEVAAPKSDGGFDSEAFNRRRDEAIAESRKTRKHLDDFDAAVETMRGKKIENVHDPRERGEVLTVDNRGSVYVRWADDYSAKKNLASEMKDERGRSLGMVTTLGPTDFKDYAVTNPEHRYDPKTHQRPGEAKPKRTNKVAREKAAFEAKLRDYFTPGNIVESYGGHDRVLALHMGEDGRWSVEVEAVEKRDGKWVAVGEVRQHATRPDRKRVVERATIEEAKHVEGGKIEEASPEVIRESVAKSAANTPMNYPEAKAALLKAIDEAIAAAPTMADKGAHEVTKDGKRSLARIVAKDRSYDFDKAELAKEIGYHTFDVPGDGRFKVLNLKERLQRFRQDVDRAAGFKPPVKVKSAKFTPPGVGTQSSIAEMFADGEYTTAYELAKSAGKPLRFGAPREDGKRPVVYTDTKEIKLTGGYPAFVGRELGEDGKGAGWSVVELSTGLRTSAGESTAAAAEARAKSVNRERLADAIEKAAKVDQATLEATWLEWAEKESESRAAAHDARVKAEEARVKQASEEQALYAEVVGEEWRPQNGARDKAGLSPFDRDAKDVPWITHGVRFGSTHVSFNEPELRKFLDRAREAGKLEAVAAAFDRRYDPERSYGGTTAEEIHKAVQKALAEAPKAKPAEDLTPIISGPFIVKPVESDTSLWKVVNKVDGRAVKSGFVSKDEALEFARAEQAPKAPVQEKAAEAPAAEAAIEDFGEKIGGARKDTAQGIGKRTKAEYVDDGSPTWRKRYITMQVLETGQINKPNVGKWFVMDKRTMEPVKQQWRVQYFDTEKEAEDAVPLLAVAQKHRVTSTVGKDGSTTYEIWRYVTDRKRVKVVDREFASREDAMRYMALNATKILETNTSFGEDVLAKPEQVMRKGEQRRTGPATKEMFADTFGFRGVEFGLWNNQAERQEVMNHAYDGLLDLADILGVPPKALSLNGDLALAFGARGQGIHGARAHYEPDYGVINLTKMEGAGALAHEWFHSLDHYFRRQDIPAMDVKEKNSRGDLVYPQGKGKPLATHGFAMRDGKVRPEVRKAIEDLVRGMFTKAEIFVEDTKRAERFVGVARDQLRKELGDIRANLLQGPEQLTYMKRNNKPATAEQIAAFDALADKLVEGQDFTEFWKPAEPRPGNRMPMGGRHTTATIEEISAIYKAVRGRSGFTAERGGAMDRLVQLNRHYRERAKMLADANSGAEKEKRVPTTYAMDAKAIDQGRVSDYWTTEHEMAARAFSAYVEDKLAAKGGESDFLSYGSDNNLALYRMLKIRPFPEGAEREAINKLFDHLFQTIQTKETDRGVALFARGSVPAGRATLSHGQMEELGTQIVASWMNAPDFKAIRTIEEAPLAVQAIARDAKAKGAKGEPYAFLHEGTIYVITGRAKTAENLLRGIFHEGLGHYGLRGLYGARLNPILDQIRVARRAEVTAKAKQYGLDMGKQEDRLLAAEEWLVEMAETHPTLGYVRRAVAAIRTFLRPILEKFGVTLRLTDDEIIRSYIIPAREWVVKGKPARVAEASAQTRASFARRDELRRAIQLARGGGNENVVVDLGEVSTDLAEAAKEQSLDIEGFHHTVDMYALRHAINRHGGQGESARGQVPLTEDDLLRIPDVVSGPATRIMGTTNARGQDLIVSIRKMDDGTMLVVEEVRTGRKALAVASVRKHPAATDVSAIARTVRPNARGDGEVPVIIPPSEPEVPFQRAGNADPFYSELARQVALSKTNAAPAAQWASTLKAMKGVKADELEWSGVLDWLATREGKVTKAEVQDYLAQNGVKVSEVMLGDDSTPATTEMDRLRVELDALGYSVYDRDGEFGLFNRRDTRDGGAALYTDLQGMEFSPEYAGPVSDIPDARAREMFERYSDLANEEAGGEPAAGHTKYSQYTLPGGTNYRELLLTLPMRRGRYHAAAVEDGMFAIFDRDGTRNREAGEFGDLGDAQVTADDMNASEKGAATGQQFRSSHFDTPNILAHVRFDERTDAEGKKVLFIEEIQSDWAQKGKREGFGDPKAPWQLFDARTKEVLGNFATEAEAKRAGAASGRGSWDYADMLYHGVPSAPFVGKTEAWVSLAVKRIIRYASENGFDRVAFTTGEQQADRYDLSKHIKELHYANNGNDTYWLSATLMDGREHGFANAARPEQLPEMVGKEVADKILRGEGEQRNKRDDTGRVLRGLDLKVGGEGMIAFYDRIVPNVINDVLKKLGGGKVTQIAMEADSAYEVVLPSGKVVKTTDSKKSADATAKDFDGATVRYVGDQSQPGFDITPEIKERAMAGMPLFARLREDADSYAGRMGKVQASRGKITDAVRDLFTEVSPFGFWHKSVGTQYHKAYVDADFKRVYDKGQDYLREISTAAIEAADQAPSLLPKMDGLSGIAKSLTGAASQKDISAIARPILEGTLQSETGNPHEGVVWNPAELREKFGLTDAQIKLYQEFRKSVDYSLDLLLASEVANLARDEGVEAAIEEARNNPHLAGEIVGDALARQAATIADPEIRNRKTDLATDLMEKQSLVHSLQEHGYAPLMRFGRFAVSAYTTDMDTGEMQLEYFSLHESRREALAAARQLRQDHPEWRTEVGTKSQDSFQLYQGLTPDTLELFAQTLGVGQESVFQQYLKVAKNSRSAMKRLIRRKGMSGFEVDPVRTLASFITSNARAVAGNWHMGELAKATESIPESKGDVKDEATKLVKYLQNPNEEASVLRNYLFVQYLGGSISAALVNMTQPFLMTFPYLAQFGAGRASESMTVAMKQAVAGGYDAQTAAALKKGEEQGVVAPHEVHMLHAESMRNLGANLHVRRLLTFWGSLFAAAEAFNRRITFIAAYRIAQARNEADPYAFAVKAVEETQGVYNRGNKPNWARGAIGSTLFTFKQFSVGYLEFLARLPARQKAAALAILFLVAGMEGLPFAEDLEDIIDTIAQALGYSFNTKKAMRRFLSEHLGQHGAQFVLHGASHLPGVPIDVQGRLGLGNLIPGSSVAKFSADSSKEALEALGVIGSAAKSVGTGVAALAHGDFGEATKALPILGSTAVQNIRQAVDMWQTGMYRTGKGGKRIDVDKTDAVMKGIGFMPQAAAQEGKLYGERMQDVNLQKKVESDIAGRWAKARFDYIIAKDDRQRAEAEKDIEKARKDLATWNEKNPGLRVVITPHQIQGRVRDLRTERLDLQQRRAPREIRGSLREQTE